MDQRIAFTVVAVFISCSPVPSAVDAGSTGGGLSGVGGGVAAAGGRAGGSGGGAVTAGGSAGGAASAGGVAAGGAAGGSSLADGGLSFCAEMAAGSNALRMVLAQCSDPGDSAIYAFNPTRCAMETDNTCTPTDQQVMRGVTACERAIAPCASAADRSRATGAINTCVMNITVSSACLASLQ